MDGDFAGEAVARAIVGSKPLWRQPSADIPSYESVPTGALDT